MELSRKIDELAIKATTKMGPRGLALQQNAPDILMKGGTVASFAGVGLMVFAAVRTTLKEAPKYKDNVIENHDIVAGLKEQLTDTAITEEQKNGLTTDLKIAQRTAIENHAKFWGKATLKELPGLALYLGGQACQWKGYNVLTDRHVTALASLAATTEILDKLKKAVTDKYGDDALEKLGNDITTKKIKYTDKDGNEQIVEKAKVVHNDPCLFSTNAVWFNSSNDKWENSQFYNDNFIMNVETMFNGLIDRRGFAFKNELYDMLGCPMTLDGADEGWIKTEGASDKEWVKLRVSHIFSETQGPDGNHFAPTCIIDFDTDGNIRNKIWNVNDSEKMMREKMAILRSVGAE